MAYLTGLTQDDLGMPTVGRPVTATLYVSADGDNTDGSTWAKAYNTLNSALDAASTDVNDLTAILLAPHATYYDINTTGGPTWSANVEIQGAHRRWSVIKNTHASATSILKLTGKSSVENLSFSQQGAVDGIIMTMSAFRIRKCGFNSSTCTGAVTAINIDGTAGTLLSGMIEDVRVIGHVSYTTGIYLDNVSYSDFNNLDMHYCLNGIQIINAGSDNNFFNHVDLGGCAIGLNIDAGSSQHFEEIHFHENTVRVDDEVGDHHWQGIKGEFIIDLEPSDLTGVEVASGNAEWGGDVELRAAATATKPFKVIGYSIDPSTEETQMIRLSADSGSTFFAQSVFAAKKNRASGSGDTTDFIFNIGTRISASGWSGGAGRTLNVWLEIQEI